MIKGIKGIKGEDTEILGNSVRSGYKSSTERRQIYLCDGTQYKIIYTQCTVPRTLPRELVIPGVEEATD